MGETLFDCVAFAGIDYWGQERGNRDQSWPFFLGGGEGGK